MTDPRHWASWLCSEFYLLNTGSTLHSALLAITTFSTAHVYVHYYYYYKMYWLEWHCHRKLLQGHGLTCRIWSLLVNRTVRYRRT